MKMIDELFYGNVSPNEKPIRRGSKLEHLYHLMTRNNEAMNAMLTDEATKAQFEKCCDSASDVNCETELLAFEEGFCLAASFMAEVMDWIAQQDNSD